MKSTTRTSTKAAKKTKRHLLGQLGGSANERNWLITFALLVMAAVVCACLVVVVKQQT